MSNVDSTPPAWPGAADNQMQPPAPQAPQGDRTNTLAIVAFIGSFFVSLLGIIAGHIALRQIKRSGEKGHGFALAGTIIGYVSLVLTAILVVVMVAGIALAASHLQSEMRSQASTNGSYSDEFCHDLFGIVKSAQAAKDVSQIGALRDAYAAVAKDSSPHQKDYQAMTALLANPSGATADQVKTATSDLSKAAQIDAVACAGRLK
jgi:uncharacterized protein YdbL (DUF1318 family)